MIDEKKLIKDIKGWQEDIHDNEYDAKKYDFVFERIYEMAEEQPRVGEWISCTERLPEEGAVVLVSLEKDEDYDWVRLVREGYYDEGYWFDTDGAHYGFEVLAWMPLPPAFKGE